jgi:hypothetical protein
VGTAYIPKNRDDDWDLSGLDSTDEPAQPKASRRDEPGEDARSSDDSERGGSSSARRDRPPVQQEDESHWGDLASSLGVAAGAAQVEPPTRAATQPPKPAPTKKAPRQAPKPASSDSESDFGRGLLDDAPVSEEESRQKQLLSELFVPTSDAYDEPPSSVRQVDDVDLVDDDLFDETDADESTTADAMLDEDMVEFEVEELSSEEENRQSEWSRRPPPSRETEPRRRERSERPDKREPDEPRSERPARPSRDEGRRRRPRRDDRDRGPAPPRRSDEKPRSQVLPADEDFIIDPIDDEAAEQEAASRPETGDTKSIKFPTWTEAVGPIIEANIARRGKTRSRPRRPPRDRGGGE